MSLSLSTRLLKALDRPEIPKHIQREVHNTVCGISAKDPNELAWKVLYADIQKHLATMRSNKHRIRADLAAVWQDYYDTLSTLPALIRKSDWSVPLPPEFTHWQGWVPIDERKKHCHAFEMAYTANPTRGCRIVPFAPQSLIRDTNENIKRCRTALRSARTAWNTSGTPTKPRSDTHLGAVILAATYQAEREIKRYVKALRERTLHPYETPAKANWQHYCDADTRAKVRRLSANPADVYFDFAPYLPYYVKQPTHQFGIQTQTP